MKSIFNIILMLLILASCDDQVMSPIDNDHTVPEPVKNVQVKNLAGAAEISYTLPEDRNLLYVKAVYTVKGVEREVKSSYFNNKVLVDGFGDTNNYDVTLYSVSRAEVESTPVTVKVQPLAPAMYAVFESLSVKESFGGFNTWYENPDKGNIVIEISKWDTVNNEWMDLDKYYTGLAGGVFSVRGMEPIETKLGLSVRDRWGNRTDTMVVILTPVYEEQLDSKRIKDLRKSGYPVPQIAPLPASGEPMENAVDYSSSWNWNRLWDGKTGNTGWHTKEKYDQPTWTPMDLGSQVRLSRYKLWQRNNKGTYLFSHGNPHEWEVWGTNDPSDVNSWVLLDHEVMVKPSGLPIGQVSNDDIAIADAGQEYEFPIDVPAVRYIAWKNIDSWATIDGATGFFHIAEMEFYGQYVNQ